MTANQHHEPVVSVLMAVKNGEQCLSYAVNSILNQSFSNFEFIIINDGSDDNTLEILSKFNDSRIKIFSHKNIGIARSVNRGLAIASGKLIARQDHDDISHPYRLQKQVNFFAENPDIALLGTCAEIWRGGCLTERYHDHPLRCEELRFELLFNNPFVNTSIMFRKEIINSVGLYSPVVLAEDYDFHGRVSIRHNVANLSERLVKYNESEKSHSSALRIEDKDQEYSKDIANTTSKMLKAYCPDLREAHSQKISTIWHGLKGGRISWFNYMKYKKVLNNVANYIFQNLEPKQFSQIIYLMNDHFQYRFFTNPGYSSLQAIFAYKLGLKVSNIVYKSKELSARYLSQIKITIFGCLSKVKNFFRIRK